MSVIYVQGIILEFLYHNSTLKIIIINQHCISKHIFWLANQTENCLLYIIPHMTSPLTQYYVHELDSFHSICINTTVRPFNHHPQPHTYFPTPTTPYMLTCQASQLTISTTVSFQVYDLSGIDDFPIFISNPPPILIHTIYFYPITIQESKRFPQACCTNISY